MGSMLVLAVVALAGLSFMWMASDDVPSVSLVSGNAFQSTEHWAEVCHCDPRTIGPGSEPDDIRLCERRCHRILAAQGCPDMCETYQQDVPQVRGFYPPAVGVVD